MLTDLKKHLEEIRDVEWRKRILLTYMVLEYFNSLECLRRSL